VGILTPNVPGVEGRLALVSLAAHVVGRELAAAEDVTERKGAEARLLREQELLERIIGTIPVMITLYQPSTRVLRVNAEFERVTGWTNEDVARADLMELCYPDPEYRAEVAEYMRSLQAGWRDIQLTTRHAGVIETAWANIRISDDTQVGIGLDLRERQRAARALQESEERFLSAERALRESEEGFRILANSIPQLAWMADAEGWIFWYNDRWYEYTAGPSRSRRGGGGPPYTTRTTWIGWWRGSAMPGRRGRRGRTHSHSGVAPASTVGSCPGPCPSGTTRVASSAGSAPIRT
jgi:PAS domain S-box-containing protein